MAPDGVLNETMVNMETLIFTQMHKNFDYENDNVVINGTVIEDNQGLVSFSGNVHLKGDNPQYLGNFNVRIEGEDTRVDINNTPEAKIDDTVAAMKALAAKLREEPASAE